jgi:hypothetical protein
LISLENCRSSCFTTTSWRRAAFRRDESESVQRLFDFLDEEECEGVENTAIGFDVNGTRGLFATEDFGEGDYILAVPLSAALLIEERFTQDSSTNSVQMDEVETEITQALTFLRSSRKEARWKRYMDTLPHVDDPFFDGTPDFWSAAALHLFPVPLLRQRNRDRLKCIQTMAHQNNIPQEELQWAVWVLRTRGFTAFRHMQDQGLRQRTLLVPLVDMVNHANDANVFLEAVDANTYEESFIALKALQSIHSGEQITLCYGTGFETSLEILDKYGFFVKQNPNDVRIDWDMVEIEKLNLNLVENDPDVSLQVVQNMCQHLYHLHRLDKEEQ